MKSKPVFGIGMALAMMLTFTSSLFAHPGHGETHGHSLLHYLTEPFHVISLAAVLIAAFFVIRWIRARKLRKASVNA